jgi:hypothetical protein
VIVSKQDAHAAHDATLGIDTHATTMVPPPGMLGIASLPPNRRIRSRMLA